MLSRISLQSFRMSVMYAESEYLLSSVSAAAVGLRYALDVEEGVECRLLAIKYELYPPESECENAEL